MTGTDANLDALFEEWEHAIKGEFQRDGIVDHGEYDKASWRILFVTKEANNILKDQRVQAREAALELFTRGKHKYPYWRALARWSYALLNGFAEVDQVEKNYASSKALLSVAIMNIKKVPGGSKAVQKRIEDFVRHNADFIIREISIINPHLIVCGGVGQTLKTVLSPAAEMKVSSEDVSYFYWGHVPVFDFRHPACRLSACNLDPPLVRSAEELLVPTGEP